MKHTHYYPTHFRKLSDEAVGFDQHRLIDLKQRKQEVKPFMVDGMNMDKESILKHREGMIRLRDAALKSNMLDWAFQISVVIAILHHLAEVMEA